MTSLLPQINARPGPAGVLRRSLAGYLNCFRYGTPPHGGLGLGLTRLLMVMLGLPTIREATFLFRGPNRLEP